MSCQNNPCAVPVGEVYAALTRGENLQADESCNSVSIGKYFANIGAIKDAVVEIINPADNKFGLIIRTCGVNGSIPTVVDLRLFADTVAPTAYDDSSRRVVYFTVTPPSGNINHPLHVPPGNGLWIATKGEGWLAISYDLLEEGDAR